MLPMDFRSIKHDRDRLDKVAAWLQMRAMINMMERFTKIAVVADGFFSDLILALYHPEAGNHAQSAIGLRALAINLPVIVDAYPVEIIA